MSITTWRLLASYSRTCSIVCRSFATYLQSQNGLAGAEIVKPHVRHNSSQRTTRKSQEGALEDGTGHQDDPLAARAARQHNEKQTNTIPISAERAQQEMLLLQEPDQPPDARTLKVAIIGSPNAGKSTLVNKLMGQRICSVSSKVHTTRTNALAVLTRNNTQIVLLDTPGMVSHLHGRKHQLSRPLLVDPKNSLQEADLAIVLVDVSNKWTCEKISSEILMALHHHHPSVPSILVLNKVDLLSTKQQLFALTAQLTEGVIGGHQFTMDDRTAYSLGKVETRPMLSHKYKPRLEGGQSTPTSKAEGAHPAECATTDSGPEISTLGQFETDLSSPDCSQHQDNELWHREHDRNIELNATTTETAQNELPTRIVNSESVSPQMVNTLEDYVSTLEGFTATSNMFESAGRSPNSEDIIEDQKSAKKEQRELLQEMSRRQGWHGFGAVFMVSALNGEGLEDVKDHLMAEAMPGLWEYHQDVVTNLSPEEILTEAVREKLLEHLPQEVPYNISQKNETWTIENNGKLRIIQKIICHKKSHMTMLKRRIGAIAREAEESLEDAFHRDVHLTLSIKY